MFSWLQTKYQPTVEDLFSKDFTLGECTLKVKSGNETFTKSKRELIAGTLAHIGTLALAIGTFGWC